jgi:hypothetical protein
MLLKSPIKYQAFIFTFLHFFSRAGPKSEPAELRTGPVGKIWPVLRRKGICWQEEEAKLRGRGDIAGEKRRVICGGKEERKCGGIEGKLRETTGERKDISESLSHPCHHITKAKSFQAPILIMLGTEFEIVLTHHRTDRHKGDSNIRLRRTNKKRYQIHFYETCQKFSHFRINICFYS